ncbi:hypothetical protein AHAS_Ahas09G0065100 [Arachis hypogaea]
MDTKCLHDSTPIPKKQQILNLRLSKNGKKKDLALLTWLLVSISNLFENKIILNGLPEEYSGYISSVMSRLSSFTIVEAESFLKAYEDMLDRFKQSKSVEILGEEKDLPLLALNANSMAISGMLYKHATSTSTLIKASRIILLKLQMPLIPYGNSPPPPPPKPPPSFHQPRAYYKAPSSVERLLLHGIAEGGIYKLRDLGTTVMSSSVDFKSNSCHNNHCLLTNLDVVSRNTHESSINTNKSESKSVNHFNSDVKL